MIFPGRCSTSIVSLGTILKVYSKKPKFETNLSNAIFPSSLEHGAPTNETNSFNTASPISCSLTSGIIFWV